MKLPLYVNLLESRCNGLQSAIQVFEVSIPILSLASPRRVGVSSKPSQHHIFFLSRSPTVLNTYLPTRCTREPLLVPFHHHLIFLSRSPAVLHTSMPSYCTRELILLPSWYLLGVLFVPSRASRYLLSVSFWCPLLTLSLSFCWRLTVWDIYSWCILGVLWIPSRYPHAAIALHESCFLGAIVAPPRCPLKSFRGST